MIEKRETRKLIEVTFIETGKTYVADSYSTNNRVTTV